MSEKGLSARLTWTRGNRVPLFCPISVIFSLKEQSQHNRCRNVVLVSGRKRLSKRQSGSLVGKAEQPDSDEICKPTCLRSNWLREILNARKS